MKSAGLLWYDSANMVVALSITDLRFGEEKEIWSVYCEIPDLEMLAIFFVSIDELIIDVKALKDWFTGSVISL